ncbi:glycosyltransferase family A protein [Chryseobacterium sp. MFBS3-17]|uniref:glycosyltransferase family A protein n=1 Tax=Chryseobacterium sp. MFBS3-17 TaxID=2886689 RepID=UPI001D0E7152|nr:glycosyltransferase family A protein [Chryseobacterium sp. MFBS3-17]MCC2589423.1 glycosyltransferase family 2 protein [Chryseobacterium sp. MFBS3-17]
MKEDKLAIIIPFFKSEFFEDTLRSLSVQTNQNFKVYIGNDGSEANPEELIKNYNQNKNLVYKKFPENLGGKGKLVEQWNRCIELSENEKWLMILADDDYLSNNFVEEFYKNMEIAENNNISLLRFKMRRVSEDGKTLTELEQPNLYLGKDYVWEDEIHKRFLSISENVFTREVYERKGFRPYPLAWRVPFMMYLDFTDAGSVMGINSAFVAIRRNDSQLSWRPDVNIFKRMAMELCYRDILNEYSNIFSSSQNLKFLKVYSFYSLKKNELKNSVILLYFKYGGFYETIKYLLKKLK